MVETKRDPKVRRVVTGHDANGKSVVWIDGFATNHKYPNERMISTLLWCTEGSPADFTVDEVAGARIIGTAPPAQVTLSADLNATLPRQPHSGCRGSLWGRAPAGSTMPRGCDPSRMIHARSGNAHRRVAEVAEEHCERSPSQSA